MREGRVLLSLGLCALAALPGGCKNEGEPTKDTGSGGAAPGAGGESGEEASGGAALGGMGGDASGGSGTGGQEPMGPASTFLPDGDAIEICTDVGSFTPSTIHFTPNVLVQGGTIAITCSSSALEWPFVIKFLDSEGTELDRTTLRQSFAQYYRDASMVYENGEFHLLKSYRCLDNGSWAVGHGWTCLEHHRFGPTGEHLIGPAIFGETGLNEYPGLASSGSILGAAWASYDDLYFRQINFDGTLVGDLESDNILLGSPGDGAGYWNSRSRMTWDGTHFGLFFAIEYQLLFYRLTETGSIATGPVNLGDITAHAFQGDLTVITHDGFHYVYYGYDMQSFLEKVSFTGEVVDSVEPVPARQPYPHMVFADGRFYLGYSDPETGAPAIAVFDPDLNEVPDAGGIVDPGATAFGVRLAHDPSTGQFVMAYGETNDQHARLQLLTRVP